MSEAPLVFSTLIEALQKVIPPGEDLSKLFEGVQPIRLSARGIEVMGDATFIHDGKPTKLKDYINQMHEKAAEAHSTYEGMTATMRFGGGPANWEVDYTNRTYKLEIPAPVTTVEPEFKPIEKERMS
jgi:hypothetical protein